MEFEFILTNSDNLSTHEKRILSGLCINKSFGAWVWKENVLISICKENDKIIGWCGFKEHPYKKPDCQIAVYVKKQYRGHGIGKKLVNMLMDKNKNVEVCCAPREDFPQGFKIFSKYENIRIYKSM